MPSGKVRKAPEVIVFEDPEKKYLQKPFIFVSIAKAKVF